MKTKKRAARRVAKPASSKTVAAPVPTSLFSLASQGFDRLRARLNAAGSSEPAASATSARKRKHLLDALARLEADFERVLKPE